MRLTRARMLVAGVGAALVLAASSLGAPAQAQDVVEVRMENIAFEPAMLSVPAGTTIVWTNYDPVIHGVAANDGSVVSPLYGQGESFSVTLTTPGVFTYFCPPHPNMVGAIEVTV